jgi:hypothetical protein
MSQSCKKMRVSDIGAVVLLVTLAILPQRLVRAAESGARPDSELVALCAKEAQDRFFEGSAADQLLVSTSEVNRTPAEDVVRIVLASGEGRTLRATCKFRAGKLFDVLH